MIKSPVIVSFLTSFLTFLGTIFLFRQLSADDAGRLTLILALVQVGVIIGGLGQATLIQRMYSYAHPNEFNWVHDLLVSILMAFPILCLAAFVVIPIYRLSPRHSFIIFALILIQITILTISRMFNAARSYAWASFIIRVPNSLLFIPAGALLVFTIERGLDFVLIAYISLALSVMAAGIIALSRVRTAGTRIVSWRERFAGIIFLFTQSSYILPDQGIVAIGGSIVAPSELAAYGAVLPLLRPFELLTDVLRNILTTELIHFRSHRHRTVVIGLWGTGLFLACVTILVGPSIAAWVYSGRYAAGIKLIPWLAVGGFFRVIEVLPRSVIIGQSDQKQLRRFVFWQVAVSGFLLVAGLSFVLTSGLIAIAWSMAAIQLGRYVVSQVHYLRGYRFSGSAGDSFLDNNKE